MIEVENFEDIETYAKGLHRTNRFEGVVQLKNISLEECVEYFSNAKKFFTSIVIPEDVEDIRPYIILWGVKLYLNIYK